MPRPIPLCAALLAVAAPAWGGDFAPGNNAGALARNFALPSLGVTEVLQRGSRETRLTLDVSNEYVAEGECAAECILLDGETARLRLSHRRGLGAGWDAAVELPLLSSGGGMLDDWIQDWHGWFGLPNGGREYRAEGEYRYYYARGGEVLLDQSEPGTSVGDMTLTLGRRIGKSGAARAMAKLPTGDDSAPGGGNSGGALWFEQGFTLGGWHGYVSIGGSFNERGAVLAQMQQREIGFAGIGLSAPLTRRLRAVAQLHAHTPLYEGSALNPLARAGVPLTLGLQLRAGPRSTFEFGFQEDPGVNASPDFGAYATFTAR
jgi:hypothetical protein